MEEQVLNTDPEAAHVETVTGWVSRLGHFYGADERLARWDGATHFVCEKCGNVYPKINHWCEPCATAKTDAEWATLLPAKEWDGDTPIVVFDSDDYFFDMADVERYCDEHDMPVGELRLVECEPQFVCRFDLLDFCENELPEDGDESNIDPAIVAAADALTKAIEDSKKPISWLPGKIAVTITLE